jgi:2',3'-cyclic-nucleotide 2'-phosphodiesterase (5'-nucleotidase family)
LLGGLARRAAWVEKVQRENQRTLVVDSGDLFFSFRNSSDSEKALKKAQIIGRAYRHMGAAAVNVGCLDLLRGVDFLRQEYSQGLPLISANLLDPSTKALIFPSYMIKEAGGVRIAFFGLLPPESGPEISPAIRRANEGRILIADPIDAARETLGKIMGKADLPIILSDLGLYKDQRVAKELPGIHFILGGHEGRFTRKAVRAGMTHIFQSSHKGMYVGRLQLTLEDPSTPFRDAGEVQYLQERIDGLDLYIRGLEAARKRQPGKVNPHRDRSIREITRQRTALQEELKRAKETGIQGNHFLFKLETMEGALPEDEEVKGWISAAGIDKD